MAVEVRFLVDSEEEKLKIELMAKEIGQTPSGFIRLLLKNWEGSITLTKNKKPDEEKKE
jgi:hypothetical protein